jgi:hypothetical protein
MNFSLKSKLENSREPMPACLTDFKTASKVMLE